MKPLMFSLSRSLLIALFLPMIWVFRSWLTYSCGFSSGKYSAKDIMKAIKKGKGKAEFNTVNGAKLMAMMDGKMVKLKDSSGNGIKDDMHLAIVDSVKNKGEHIRRAFNNVTRVVPEKKVS